VGYHAQVAAEPGYREALAGAEPGMLLDDYVALRRAAGELSQRNSATVDLD
jgi:hypothetical protein